MRDNVRNTIRDPRMVQSLIEVIAASRKRERLTMLDSQPKRKSEADTLRESFRRYPY